MRGETFSRVFGRASVGVPVLGRTVDLDHDLGRALGGPRGGWNGSRSGEGNGTDNANPIENVVNVPRHATHVTCR